MNVANIQAAYYMVAATGVLIAALYYIINLRSNTRAREMEIVRLHTSDLISEQRLQGYSTLMNLKWKDAEDFWKKYWVSNPEVTSKWVSYFLAFEATGILIKNKVAKAELIYDLGAHGATELWEKFKDVIQVYRAEYGQDTLRNAEFFVQEMQKIQTRNAARIKTR